MHFKNTLEAVSINIDELNQLVGRIGTDDKLFQIDIDLALDKLRHVYDLMLELKQVDILHQDKDVNQNHSINEPVLEVERNTEEVSTMEIEEPKEDSVQPEEEPEKEAPIEEPPKTERAEPTESKSYLGDSLRTGGGSLNEEIAHRMQDENLAARIKGKPINDISKAIGLNDKFEFINELFGRDSTKYTVTIETLNTAKNFNEAFDFLLTEFNWDMDSPSVQKLLDLVRRKFITA